MMSSDKELEIASCLAYEVLRHPDDWLGAAVPSWLQCFLQGTHARACYVQPDLPLWRINGVLADHAFYKPFVRATGHPLAMIRAETALEMAHFSLAAGFATLRDEAIAWHRAHGVRHETRDQGAPSKFDIDEFWSYFAKRPGMYIGTPSGWLLYCFLNGMQRGGDWLGLPEMPRLHEIFGGMKSWSEKHYGSSFAAFRFCNVQGLFKQVGLASD